MNITLWKSLTDAHGTRVEMTWEELAQHLSVPAPKPADAENPKLAGWSPATFAGDKRAKANVELVTALGLDHDKGALSLDRLIGAYAGTRVLIHNTRRSTPDAPRWRVVVALSRPVTVEEHAAVWAWARAQCADLGIFVDEQTKDPSRFWFVPCEPSEGEFTFHASDGATLDVDAILADSAAKELPRAIPVATPAPKVEAPTEADDLAKIKSSTRRRRAAKYVERAEPAVSGESGHATAMRVVTAVVRGFALDEATALEVLAPWNDRCEPPWSPVELVHKVREATRVGALVWGSKLLSEAPERPETEGNAARKKAPRELWEHKLIRRATGDKEVKRLVANVITILTHADEWRGAIAWDEFAAQVVITRECPAGKVGPWDDVADIRTADWLQRSKWQLEAGDDLVAKAARAVANDTRIHPVRDWLRSLTWDGTRRIDDWLVKYLGVEESVYARAVGRRFLISAVARIFRPGCQVDTMLILEGDQGLRKSSALRALTSDKWFLDAAIDVRNPEAASALRKKWIVEFSELAALKGGDVERVKQFVSTRVDNYRQKYGRYFEDHPRQCVLVGSTNAKHYLKDETGARRFWPVRVTSVDIEALLADRVQLWAEAVAALDSDEPWYLDNAELRSAAEEEQEHRRSVDPWEEVIQDYLSNPTRSTASIRVSDVLLDCLKLEVSKRTRFEEMRVGAILSKLGYERRRVMNASSRSYQYFPPEGRAGKAEGRAPESSTESNACPTCPTYPTSIRKDYGGEVEIKEHLIGNGEAGEAGRADDAPGAFDDLIGDGDDDAPAE